MQARKRVLALVLSLALLAACVGMVPWAAADDVTQVTLAETKSQWKYRTFSGSDRIADTSPNWNEAAFDDSGWTTGQAPFGNRQGEREGNGTLWDGGDYDGAIYLRKTFTLSSQEATLYATGAIYLSTYFDDNPEYYLNGHLIYDPVDWNNSYDTVSLGTEFSQYFQEGVNVFAILCTNATGGREIDSSLYLELPSTDSQEVQAQIDALAEMSPTEDGLAAYAGAVNAAAAAYRELGDRQGLVDASGLSLAYQALADAYGGKLLDMNFDGNDSSDVLNRVTGTVGSSNVSFGQGRSEVDGAVCFTGTSSGKQDPNKYVRFSSAEYNPLSYADKGVTISLVARQTSGSSEIAALLAAAVPSQHARFLYITTGHRVGTDNRVANGLRLAVDDKEVSMTEDFFNAHKDEFVDQWAVYTVTQTPEGHTTLYVNGEVAAETDELASIVESFRFAGMNAIYALGCPVINDWIGDPSLNGDVSDFEIYSVSMDVTQVKELARTALADLTVSSEGSSTVQEDSNYSLAWNVRLLDGDVNDFVAFNNTYTVVDHGVIVTATKGDMLLYGAQLAEDENPAASVEKKAYKTSFGHKAFSNYTYRRTKVAADRERYTMFYVTYADAEGHTVTALSETVGRKAATQ